MNFEVVHNISQNCFEVKLDNKKAVLNYMISNSLFILMHTEVPPAYEGRGIASGLAYAALEYARREGFKVRSYCSFTTVYIERHPAYKDLLG
jgi:predicted GNAT family acetyltransferase